MRIHARHIGVDYEGGFRRKTNFIEIAKRLIDDIHGDFHRAQVDFVDANAIARIGRLYCFLRDPQSSICNACGGIQLGSGWCTKP